MSHLDQVGRCGTKRIDWGPVACKTAANSATAELCSVPSAHRPLADLNAVGPMPAGWPGHEGVVQIPLVEEAALPLLLVWPLGPIPLRFAASVRG